jgi:hypothetical protein
LFVVILTDDVLQTGSEKCGAKLRSGAWESS